MAHECPCCGYSTCRITDWHRHIETAKHRRLVRGHSVKSRYICYICMYGTERSFNLKAHLQSHCHLQNYLHILLGSSKLAEQWEEGLIAERKNCVTIEQIRLVPTGYRLSARSEVRLIINALLSIEVTSRPIIPVHSTFWLLYTAKGWKRVSPLSVLTVLRWRFGLRIANASNIEQESCISLIAYLYKPKTVQSNNYICRMIHSALAKEERKSEHNMVELGLTMFNGV